MKTTQLYVKKKQLRLQKRRIYYVWYLMFLFYLSCGNKEANEQPLSDEQISFNLSKNGKTDPKLLIGEWDAVAFAYTANGHKIYEVVKIKSAHLVIPVAPTGSECKVYDPEIGSFKSSVKWGLECSNSFGWLCSISGNSIKFTSCGGTKMGLPCPDEENDILKAFYNAYSFVIKGNELMIFFTEEDKEINGYPDYDKRCFVIRKKVNLIIFKKR